MRKSIGAALALCVAGGVYLAAAPASASNMGFKLERQFKLEKDDLGRLYQNLYFVSFPLFNGLDPNLANTMPSPATANKCVNDPGPPDGPSVGDDFLNADDALCDMWTSRDGNMSIQHWIPSDAVGLPLTGLGCSFETRTAERTSFGIAFTGGFTGHDLSVPAQPIAAKDWRTDEYRGVGYVVNVGDRRGTAAPLHLNNAVIVGSHDPSFAGRTITAPCRPASEFLNVPYHTMYRTAAEILCGLGPPNGDWEDLLNNQSGNPGPDGEPDECPGAGSPGPGGVFDETAPRGYLISIRTFDNVKDGSLPPGGGTIPTDNTFMSLSANLNSFGTLRITGSNFNLIPGEAYRLDIPQTHTSTLWRSPHF